MGALDLILLAMIAGFIFLRLRGELGNKTGNEPLPPAHGGDTRRSAYSDNRIHADPQPSDDGDILDMVSDPALRRGYQDIRRFDGSFHPADFLIGATSAYKMILEAFWAGDKAVLEEFLDDGVYQQFSDAIDVRIDAGLTLENSLIAVNNATVSEVRMHGSSSELTVDFTADVIAVTRDADGNVVDGDVSDGTEYNDRWVFARNTHSDDPNWTLVATRAV